MYTLLQACISKNHYQYTNILGFEQENRTGIWLQQFPNSLQSRESNMFPNLNCVRNMTSTSRTKCNNRRGKNHGQDTNFQSYPKVQRWHMVRVLSHQTSEFVGEKKITQQLFFNEGLTHITSYFSDICGKRSPQFCFVYVFAFGLSIIPQKRYCPHIFLEGQINYI